MFKRTIQNFCYYFSIMQYIRQRKQFKLIAFLKKKIVSAVNSRNLNKVEAIIKNCYFKWLTLSLCICLYLGLNPCFLCPQKSVLATRPQFTVAGSYKRSYRYPDQTSFFKGCDKWFKPTPISEIPKFVSQFGIHMS